MPTSTSEKVRENRLRAAAKRQGLELHKSRTRDPRALDFDRWTVVSTRTVGPAPAGWSIQNLDLNDVERYLTTPRPERELWRIGRVFIESDGANRDELRALVLDASGLGWSVDQIEHLSGVPREQVAELTWGRA